MKLIKESLDKICWEDYYDIDDSLVDEFDIPLEIGRKIPNYDFVLKHILVAKEEYWIRLADNAVDVVLLCLDSNGNEILCGLIDSSLYSAYYDIEQSLVDIELKEFEF